jgi:predicted enzyme related to lactoylglutathione lyase
VEVTGNQPEGTPTWIDLGIPDLDRAMDFYGSVLGWEFEVGPAEWGRYTTCRLRGKRVAAMSPIHGEDGGGYWWQVYLATDDVDATTAKVSKAGGTVVAEPSDVMDQGRMALVRDPVGAQFGLWQGRNHTGAELVNEPGTLVRNDLVTADPEPARAFYAEVFGFTLDGNPDLPDFDFTFLRRPDGHEVGGIMGQPGAPSGWNTVFEVADTDAAIERIVAGGGSSAPAEDFVYGRMATAHDPFGTEFSIIARPATG